MIRVRRRFRNFSREKGPLGEPRPILLVGPFEARREKSGIKVRGLTGGGRDGKNQELRFGRGGQ